MTSKTKHTHPTGDQTSPKPLWWVASRGEHLHMIADMLEVLKILLAMNYDECRNPEAWEGARRAIAKAEGKEP